MRILAIDPGTEQSAFVVLHGRKPVRFDILRNQRMVTELYEQTAGMCVDLVAIEMVESFGKAVGKHVFETCVWIGRYIEASAVSCERITRSQIKLHLCHATAKVTDSVIRQRLVDLYGGHDTAIGGVKCRKCKGKGWFGAGRPECPVCGGGKWKHPPGPLHGITADSWQALAVGVVCHERKMQEATK